MDPLSVTASVIAVATLAGQTCKYLKELRTLMGALPGRLHTLNNEVADMELVLQSVADLIQPIGMPSGGGGGLNAAVGGASKTIGSTGATTANSSSGAADPENENYQSSGGPPDLPPAPAHAHAHATTTTTTTTATNTTIDISKSTGPTDEELHVITTVVSRAQGYLDELRTLADQIQRAGGRSKTARLSRLKAFRRELPRLNTLQDELTRVKANLNVILGAANT
ncbi:hypothetical protein GGR51DRAFT_356970 [Nemania sp. FL0031]|nr:hypothetical protein GGR51DRAFT_356970 [Nemania sp. FL0031]